jgi:crotonobetainyl-CoA:carnitine CoA-transferase CaiB-like acyl-CoA transferase
VQTSLLETALAWLSMHIASYLGGGDEPTRQGTRSPFFAPYEAYQTADGQLVVVGTGGDGGWQSFCRALELPELADDPRFASNKSRVANAEALREAVEAVMTTRPTEHWVQRMHAERIPYAPVQTLPEVLRSEQVAALGAISRLTHRVAGEIPIVRLPLTMSGAHVTATDPPPALDGDGDLGFRKA